METDQPLKSSDSEDTKSNDSTSIQSQIGTMPVAKQPSPIHANSLDDQNDSMPSKDEKSIEIGSFIPPVVAAAPTPIANVPELSPDNKPEIAAPPPVVVPQQQQPLPPQQPQHPPSVPVPISTATQLQPTPVPIPGPPQQEVPPHHAGPPSHHMPPHVPHQGISHHPGMPPHPSYAGYPPPSGPPRSPYYPPQYAGHPQYPQYPPYPYHQQYAPPGHYMGPRPPMHYPEHGPPAMDGHNPYGPPTHTPPTLGAPGPVPDVEKDDGDKSMDDDKEKKESD